MKPLWLLLCLALCGCGPEKPARPAFRAEVVVHGDSMLPKFHDGERIGLEFCRYEDLAGGDTVVFWHELAHTYAHHALVYRDNTGRWITKGYNNAFVDSGVMSSDDFEARSYKLEVVK